LSGYKEALEEGRWGKYNFIGKDKKEKMVAVLKEENFGEEMSIDEKMIDEEFYTVMTNRQTGKIALLAETTNVEELTHLMNKIPSVREKVKEITLDMSPTYEKFCQENFADAIQIIDKFHVVKHMVEAVQSLRIRLKQEEQNALPKSAKERRKVENEMRLANGETRIELLTRSRYLLFKMRDKWKPHQEQRAALLFKTFPVLKTAYELVYELRKWIDKSNVGKSMQKVESELIEWYNKAEGSKIPEIENLVRLISNHEEKIMNYFIRGKTNAKAEKMNGKMQRFITTNYGIRDKDFFMYRLAKYFS
jgi:transposase